MLLAPVLFSPAMQGNWVRCCRQLPVSCLKARLSRIHILVSTPMDSRYAILKDALFGTRQTLDAFLLRAIDTWLVLTELEKARAAD